MRHATVLFVIGLALWLTVSVTHRLRHPLHHEPAAPIDLHERVNVNTADRHHLQLLPGIGPATAEHIITHRQRHGPFRDLDDLDAVHRLGPKTLARFEAWVTFDDANPFVASSQGRVSDALPAGNDRAGGSP